MRILTLLIYSLFALGLFALSSCETSRIQFEDELPLMPDDASYYFGKWEQVVFAVDTTLLPASDLQRNEIYVFDEDFTYMILNPRMFANSVEGKFEIDLENNRIDLIPLTDVPVVLNGDSLSIDLEIKPWYWEIVSLVNDTLTIKEYDRTGRFIDDGGTHFFVKTE